MQSPLASERACGLDLEGLLPEDDGFGVVVHRVECGSLTLDRKCVAPPHQEGLVEPEQALGIVPQHPHAFGAARQRI